MVCVLWLNWGHWDLLGPVVGLLPLLTQKALKEWLWPGHGETYSLSLKNPLPFPILKTSAHIFPIYPHTQTCIYIFTHTQIYLHPLFVQAHSIIQLCSRTILHHLYENVFMISTCLLIFASELLKKKKVSVNST